MNIAHAHASHGSRFWTPGCGFFCSRCHTCTRGRPKQGRIRLCQGIAPRMIRNQPRVVCCQKHIAVTRSATEWKEMGRSGEDVAERPKQRQMMEERRRPRRSHSRGAVAMRSPLAHDKMVWFDSSREKLARPCRTNWTSWGNHLFHQAAVCGVPLRVRHRLPLPSNLPAEMEL